MERNAKAIHLMKYKKMIVLLENCLKDVPKIAEKTTEIATEKSKNTKKTLSLQTSLLNLQLPGEVDDKELVRNHMTENDALLYLQKMAEPLFQEIKTPLSSGNSSVVDFTPPSSVASARSIIEHTSTTLEDINSIPEPSIKTVRVDLNNRMLKDKYRCRDLRIEVHLFEPTLRQLQVLQRRNQTSQIVSRNNCGERSLRPKSSLKKFVPFMFQHAKYMRKKRKWKDSTQPFHSTPKSDDSLVVDKVKKKRTGIKISSSSELNNSTKLQKKRRKLSRKQKQAREVKELKLKLKQKEMFEKKQLKLALKKKKEALKKRNKYENALDSINRRIYNQNKFWRMLPR